MNNSKLYLTIKEFTKNQNILIDKFIILDIVRTIQEFNYNIQLVKKNGLNLKDIKNPCNLVCLEAVKQDGYVLEFVKEQTVEICLEAVKQNGYALEFVKEQTFEICLKGVKQNGDALQFVKCHDIKNTIKLNYLK